MEKKSNLCFPTWGHSLEWPKYLRAGVIFLLFFGFSLAVSAQSIKVSLKLEDATLVDAFRKLRKTSGYTFLYQVEEVMKCGRKTLKVDNMPLDVVLGKLLSGTGLTWRIEDETVLVKSVGPAQAKTKSAKLSIVKGKVMDVKGKGLPGVAVVVQGTTFGVSTDASGKFILSLPDVAGKKLQFSMVGMESKEVLVLKDEEMLVTMKEEATDLDEVVVIGFGSSTKRDLTGDVARFDAKIIEESTATNVAEMMQGQIPGLSILAGDGTPGSPARLEIRGVPSLSGATSPLIVLNNVPMPMDFDVNELNPSDIKSIDVLKGASSAAIYGSRAAAGVIMITTKTGYRNQKPVISYSYDYNRSALVSDVKTLTTEEFKVLLMEGVRNEAAAQGTNHITEDRNFKRFSAPDYFGEANTPWMELMMRDATKQQHRVSIRGGGSNSSYTASFGFTTEPGMLKSTSYKRYTWDLGFDTDINEHIKANFNASGNFANQLRTGMWGMSGAAQARPDLKAYNDDGSYYLHSYISFGREYCDPNPLIEMNENTTRTKSNDLRLTAALNFRILPSLTLNTSYTHQVRKGQDRYYASSRTKSGSGYWQGQKGEGRESWRNSVNREVEARLSWTQTFKEKHDISMLGAFTFSDEEDEYYGIKLTDFPDDYVQNAFYQGTNPADWGFLDGDSRGSILMSFVGRAEYKFNHKYLISAAVRADGSSKFAPSHRWGYFPSVAGAWIISEEKFLKDSKWLSFLKLRSGWGVTGNGWVGEYGWRTIFSPASYENKPGVIPETVGNDELKWESTKQWDLSLEFGLLERQRVSGNITWYKKKTDGLLYPFTLALSTGMRDAKVNFANIENKGIEFSLNANIIQKKDWNWSFGFNIGKNRNKVTNLDAEYVSTPGSTYLYNTVIKEGESLGLLFGFETDGIFQSWEEVNRYEALNEEHNYQESYRYNQTIPGDIKLVDQNGDGYVDREWNVHTDKVVLGCSRPDFEGGFNTRLRWKNFSFSMQGTFSYGGDKAWTALEEQFSFYSYGTANLLDVALNRWRPECPNNKYPAIRLDHRNNDLTSFAVHDASFLKIQNVNLEYSVPTHVLDRVKFLSKLSVFVSAKDLVTFTSYPGPCPESYSRDAISGASLDSDAYPMTRTFSAGVKITLK